MNSERTTALDQFQRLETIGLWRADAEAQRREVVVAFGAATLVISEGTGRVLAHWSLPAVVRLNPGEEPALFAPDGDGSETLEIEDALMVEAISRVQTAVAAAMPRPRRLRRAVIAGIVLAIAAAALSLPQMARKQALALVPQATRQEIGATLLGLMSRETGAACRAPAGVAALERLVRRLYGPGSRLSIAVLPGEMAGMVILPGRILVVPRSALSMSDDPLVFAGGIVAARAGAGGGARDPLAPVLEGAGLRATVSLLATGTIPARNLEAHAHELLHEGQPLADDEALARAFDATGVSPAAWARATGHSFEGETGENAPVMPDSDWISLQSICAG